MGCPAAKHLTATGFGTRRQSWPKNLFVNKKQFSLGGEPSGHTIGPVQMCWASLLMMSLVLIPLRATGESEASPRLNPGAFVKSAFEAEIDRLLFLEKAVVEIRLPGKTVMQVKGEQPSLIHSPILSFHPGLLGPVGPWTWPATIFINEEPALPKENTDGNPFPVTGYTSGKHDLIGFFTDEQREEIDRNLFAAMENYREEDCRAEECRKKEMERIWRTAYDFTPGPGVDAPHALILVPGSIRFGGLRSFLHQYLWMGKVTCEGLSEAHGQDKQIDCANPFQAPDPKEAATRPQ